MGDKYHTDIRLQLLTCGYKILPNKDKRCLIKGWNTPAFAERESTAEQVARWPALYSRFTATGLLMRDGVASLDGDVDDADGTSALLADIIPHIAPKLATRAPTRYSEGTHKFMLFCRVDLTDPALFFKHGSRTFRRPGEAAGHKVEAFGGGSSKGGNSWQCGIYGPRSHDNEGNVLSEYIWDEARPCLHEVALADLPLVTPAQLYAIMDGFEAWAIDAGWVEQEKPDTAAAGPVYDITELTRFDTDKGECGISYAELCDALPLYGDFGLRCRGNFIKNWAGSDRIDHCGVFQSPLHDCVAVYVHGSGEVHFPVEHAPVDAAAFAEALGAVAAKNQGPDTFFNQVILPTDFYAYLPEHKYIYAPTGTLWPAASVNAIFSKIDTLKAARWLDTKRAVQQMTWAPGEPVEIKDRLILDGGWIDRPGTCVFNQYRPPPHLRSNSSVKLWRDHLERLYPTGAGHIEAWFAQRQQRPAEKINHALAWGGAQGIGKDTLIEPLKYAVGAWNFHEVGPQEVMERFNGYRKSVVLRISEARDLGSEFNRYSFYARTKALIAAPPDTLRIDEKNRQEYYIPNVVGVIITFNELDSLYLPADDRRHFVAWTEVVKEEFDADYWQRFWAWYANGGLAAVASYLSELDIRGFDAKRPPPLTDGFHAITSLSRVTEDADMADALEAIGWPAAVTTADVAAAITMLHNYNKTFHDYLTDSKNSRKIFLRFSACGYSPVYNPDSKQGLWLLEKRRQVIFVRNNLSPWDKMGAAVQRAKQAVQ